MGTCIINPEKCCSKQPRDLLFGFPLCTPRALGFLHSLSQGGELAGQGKRWDGGKEAGIVLPGCGTIARSGCPGEIKSTVAGSREDGLLSGDFPGKSGGQGHVCKGVRERGWEHDISSVHARVQKQDREGRRGIRAVGAQLSSHHVLGLSVLLQGAISGLESQALLLTTLTMP